MITTTQIDNHAADSLFRMLDHGKKKSIESDRFLDQLARTGILRDDPRIQELLGIFDLKENKDLECPDFT